MADWAKEKGLGEGEYFTDEDTGREMYRTVGEDRKPKVYWLGEKGELVGPMPYVQTLQDLLKEKPKIGTTVNITEPEQVTASKRKELVKKAMPAPPPAPGGGSPLTQFNAPETVFNVKRP